MARTARGAGSRDVRLRTARVALSLAGVLALQLWMCWGRLGAPFLDTRLHYSYDNADFSFKARSGNRNGDLRSQLGVTNNAYSRWGERRGNPTYYTDHPFLLKALFQQYTKIVGTEEWASRSFSLAVSFAVAAGLYAILLQATGSLLASLAGAATLVSLPLFAVYQTSVKFETDGMLIAVWLFAAWIAYRRSGSRRALAAYGILTGLAFWAHWTAILFVGALGAWLLLASWLRRDPADTRALRVTLAAGALGAATLLALMSFVQGGWRPALGALGGAFASRASAIPARTWWARQWLYAKLNFGEGLLWLALGPVLVLAGHRLWTRRFRATAGGSPPDSLRLLGVFAVCASAAACAWLLAFPQGSFVHVYWQYWLCLPVATLVASALASLRGSRAAFAVGATVCGALVIHLLTVSRASYAGVFADQLGTKDDIAFLRSLREDRFERFVFVPVGRTPLNQWFQGPLFEYYTDRPVVVADSAGSLQARDKLLVLRYVQRDELANGIARWSHKRLSNEKCGLRICAYDVLEPS